MVSLDDTIVIHHKQEQDFEAEYISGKSLIPKEARPVYSKSFGSMQEWSAPKDAFVLSRVPKKVASVPNIRRLPPKTLGIAGRGLPQFNSSQMETGPDPEIRLVHKTLASTKGIGELAMLNKAVAALRHNQQVGMKGPTAISQIR